jgi:hypothetical protein
VGRRSRKRQRPAAPKAAAPAPAKRPAKDRANGGSPDRNAAMKRGYSRSEAKNEAVRAELEPLAPGERPRIVTIAALVALGLALANVGLWLAGVKVSGREPNVGSTVLQAVILIAAAAGMWRAKYWAVLGFQALLGLTILLAALALLVASNPLEAVVCLAIIGLGGWLFWKLVRALARLQMPERRARPPVV